MNGAPAALRPRQQVSAALALGGIAALIALLPGPSLKAAVCIVLLIGPFALWVIETPLRWLWAFVATAWMLPPLPFELGNSGPHIAILFAGLGLFAGLLRVAEWELRLDWVSCSLLAMFGACVASLAFALGYSGPEVALASAARVGLLGISIYTFLYLRDGPGSGRVGVSALAKMIFIVGTISAVLACVDFYYQLPAPAGYGPQYVWLDSGVYRRAQGVFYEASTLGNVCAFVLAMVLVALIARPRKLAIPRWALLGGAIPLSIALVLSYSRASLVNVLMAAAVLLWLMRRRVRLFRAAVGVAGIALVAVITLRWLFPSFFDAWLLRATASVEYFTEAPNAVFSGRLRTWTQLGDYAMAHPVQVLFGVGYKTLSHSGVTGSAAIADNAYLSMLIETGIAGLLALLSLNAAILAACYRALKSTDPLRSFLGTWFFCFWCGQMVQMLSADLLTYWRLLPAYFCVLALATETGREAETVVRILVIDQFSELGGAQLCLLDVLEEVRELGWSATVAIPPGGPLAGRIEQFGFDVVPIRCGPYRSVRKGVIDSMRFAVDSVSQRVQIAQLLKQGRYDLVYVNGPRVLAAAAGVGANGPPMLFHAHSRPMQAAAVRVVRSSLHAAGASVVACCRYVADAYEGAVDGDRMCIVPNGVPDLGWKARAFGPGAIRIGMIGRIEPAKQQLLFVEAARMMMESTADCKFVICGSAPPGGHGYEARIRAAAVGLPLDVVPWTPHIADVMGSLDVLVVPSFNEGMPRVILEAFSAGVPVAAFPSGGVAEIIRDGDTGFLSSELTTHGLATRLLQVINAGSEGLAAVAHRARREWEERFTAHLFRRRVTELMSEVVVRRAEAS